MERRVVVTERDCPARLVPVGTQVTIPKDSFITLTQALGGSYTVTWNGNMARIDGTDADAIGMDPLELQFEPRADGMIDMAQVQTALSSVYDPEIPVDIVNLGLVYDVAVDQQSQSVTVTMTLTAPGCGMGPVLVGDVEYRLAKVPNVRSVAVELVFDPPWAREMMSEEAQLETGMFF